MPGVDASTRSHLDTEQSDTRAVAGHLRMAAQMSGVLPGDPLAPVVEAFANTVVHLGQEQRALRKIAAATVNQFDDLIRKQTQLVEATTTLSHVRARKAETALLERVANASALAASSALSRRARALDRRAAAIVGLCIATSMIVGACGGWWAGYNQGVISISMTDAGLYAALSNGQESAALWLDLMRWNDPRVALQICRQPGEIQVQAGRRSCRVPLWVEKPSAAKP